MVYLREENASAKIQNGKLPPYNSIAPAVPSIKRNKNKATTAEGKSMSN